MYSYKYGGKDGTTHNLTISDDQVVVRTRNVKNLADAVESEQSKQLLNQFSPVVEFPEANVFVLRGRQARESPVQLRDRARQVLSQEDNIRFAGRVLEDADTKTPVVYTENLFVKFNDEVEASAFEAVLKKYNLTVRQQLGYAKNAFFVSAPEDTGLGIFDISMELLAEPGVEYCHPELIRPKSRRAIAPQQWHLKRTKVKGRNINAHVNVEEAWTYARGQQIVIAVIDDGVDIDHEEFGFPGKVVHPRDVTLDSDDPRPKDPYPYAPDNHGTACAGVACAAGQYQASGVAPEARLMPIRQVSNLGSIAEANAFAWAANHGADVISCSWGPADGEWWNPNDARHYQTVLLPDSTRLAMDYALTHGRNGKGCVIIWAAGNGNESVDNDGYASYDPVIAVAACNDTERRSVYSDYGQAVWCCFPSNDVGDLSLNHPSPKTPGIWTTDRSGRVGYNPGVINPAAPTPGDNHGNYTDSFGGTSSACPGVAGIAALILSANPELHRDQVKEILRYASVKIDLANGDYDAFGHSPRYGYGRPDAAEAVKLALALKDEDNRLEDDQPSFEALVFEVGASPSQPALEIASQVAEEVLGRGWKLEPVENSLTEFDALYVGDGKISIDEAWNLTYRLRQHRDVAYADPSFVVALPGITDIGETDAGVPSAATFRSAPFGTASHLAATESNYEWSLDLIKAKDAWKLEPPRGKKKGQGIRVGHPDSGFRKHPELKARVRTDVDWDFYDDDENAEDEDGNHGLGTASVIMSRDNRPSSRPYVSGAAPKAQLVPLRVTRNRGLVPAPVLLFGGMRRLRKAINYAVDHRCHVISMSLGGPFKNESLRRALQRAVDHGVIVLAAAGNEVGFVVYPARYDEVIAVAACNIERKPWRGSSRGPAVDVTAPGESVWKATINENGPDVVRGNGTSFAVATSAGVAALWLAFHGRQNLIRKYGQSGVGPVFKEMLKNSCESNADLPPHKFGAGVVNALKLLETPLPATAPARGMRALPTRSILLKDGAFGELSSIFEDVPPSALRFGLSALLQTPEDELPAVLVDAGDELAFSFMVDPQLYENFLTAVSEAQPTVRSAGDWSVTDNLRQTRRQLAARPLSQNLKARFT